MISLKLNLCLACIALSGVAFGQVPALNTQLADEEQPITISQLKIAIEVVGNVATTTYDMVFFNPNSRVMEGELAAPLNDGQEVFRYALDVNGTLREAVIVEKIKARQTFEAVVRQNIDPGVISKTKGNFFKTRIYPIPAKGNKRVVLGMVETLPGDDQGIYYTLPAGAPQVIGTFDLTVKVIKGTAEGKTPVSQFENIRFDTRDDVYYLTFNRTNYSLSEPLRFTIPQFDHSAHQFYTETRDGETYFYLRAKAPELDSRAKPTPKSIAIYWDHSHSATGRAINKELLLLEKYLTGIPGTKEVCFYGFNYQVEDAKTFSIASDATSLIDHIRQLPNDGATRLDQIRFDPDADEILLFSDAVNTIGEAGFSESEVPIYCISSGQGANFSLLRKTAARSDGLYIDLNKSSVAKTLEQMATHQEKLLSVAGDPSGVSELYPRVPTSVKGYVDVAGILKAGSSEITLSYGAGGKVTHTQTFKIVKNATNAPVSRIWASKKIGYLEWDFDKNEQLIFDLGRKHSIVTRNASLLVLDRVEDYVAHEIVPPAELREAYDRLIQLKQPEPKASPEEIRQRNTERLQQLWSWYTNPAKADRTSKRIQTADDAAAVELDGEIMEETFIEEVVFEEAPAEDAEPVRELLEMPMNALAAEAKTEMPADGSSIKVLSWLPDAPYMAALRAAGEEDLDSIYYVLKAEHVTRPSFYIQVADLFFEKELKAMAVQVLSNVIELDLENPELLKVAARRLMDEGVNELAISIFKEVRHLRPEEPQSYRDLAQAYVANRQYQEALNEYLYILDRQWERFEDIKSVVLNELNHLISSHKSHLNLKVVAPEYLQAMPLDVRVVIDWSSNDNDIDLWVIDPKGEKCLYSHPATAMGGKISTDFTAGYGPEEFSLKTAGRGTYTVYANYYSDSRQRITGPVTVYVTLYTHYGTPQEKSERLTIQLADGKDVLQVGQLEFEGD